MDEDPSKNLDPRKVLRILNEVGITHVNAQSLKSFMTDLKKLMRYDMAKAANKPQTPVERLHSASTLSSRMRSARPKADEPQRPASAPAQHKMKISEPRKMRSSHNFIRVGIPENVKKSDPVALYSYYSTMWEKFKPHIPGENDWNDLRWSVRRKTMGERDVEVKRLVEPSDQDLAKRREAWID